MGQSVFPVMKFIGWAIEFMNVIDRIYTNAAKPPESWQESDIISDYTGMTAHGSVEMALVCKTNNRSLQHTPAVRHGERT